MRLGDERLPERFWAKVRESEDGCWTWTAAVNRGYGRFHFNGANAMAYRVAYTELVGGVPGGLHLDHLCRNRACVNPDHLEPVTQRENNLRGESPLARKARQTHCKRGHEFTEANTYRMSCGGRRCRTCARARSGLRPECDHPGYHVKSMSCPECGRFSGHGWQTDWYQTQDGNDQRWGGTCRKCGEWSESAA